MSETQIVNDKSVVETQSKNELKCPFCQQELELTMFARGREFVSCNNPNCVISDWGGCSKQIIMELITTRKALDYATEMLTRIAVSPETMLEPEKIVPQLAGQALEQINEIKGGKDA